jgi:CheY-like chemotaxis protein
MNESRDVPARVLIVDDSAQIHTDFRRVLLADSSRPALDALEDELFGATAARAPVSPPIHRYEVDSAFQGWEAVDLVERARHDGRPYAVVFCDMRMPPGYDGVTTIRKIWERQPGIEAVICTAYSDYSWDEIVRELGAEDRVALLKKPFAPADVQRLAQTLVIRWRAALTQRSGRL